MSTPQNCKFSKDHEWARDEGGRVVVGITDHAQVELGDIVFVELPEIGAAVSKGESFGTVESVKAVSDVYSPVDGVVEAINEGLGDAPDSVNSAPYTDGWMIAITPSDSSQLGELMDASAYDEYVAEISK
ncbi:MAG: glycine cleavage system protein GcvH [Bdellovibrionales bacterium]|nr:glycine cleavage system protein GcvH [Bdellovibrionales bacterium]